MIPCISKHAKSNNHHWLTVLAALMVVVGSTQNAHSVPLAPDDPSISGGLTVWLRDAVNNFDGTTWNDISGNNNHATPSGLLGEATYIAPSLSAFEETTGAFAGLNVSGVRFDGQTDDLLQVPAINNGFPIFDATTIIVYSSPPAAGIQRPIGLGTIQTTVGELDQRPVVFNPSDDNTIRLDWGSSGAGELTRPANQIFVRGSTLGSGFFLGEGFVSDYYDGEANHFDTLVVPGGPGLPVDDTLYIGDVRAGATPVFGATATNDLFVAEVITYDSALSQQQISDIGEWLQTNIAVSAFNELPSLTIDRSTGSISLENNTADALDITGYSLTSAAGSLDQSNWTTIAGNFDASGDGSVGGNWTCTSRKVYQ